MKMLKKALSVVVASAMTISLAACGSGNAGSSDTFKIGGIGPTTGAGAAYGLGVKNATQLAVDEINAAGGINGYQIEFNFQDDELDAEKAVNAYNSLKDWNCQILLGCVTSGCCIAVTDKTKEDNMFQITPSGSAVECTQYENNFRVCFSDPAQGAASAQYIGENNLASKVALIYAIYRSCGIAAITTVRYSLSSTLLAGGECLPAFFLFRSERYDVAIIITVW